MVMYSAVVLAAGDGRRIGLSENKVFKHIAGMSVLNHALSRFEADAACAEIILVGRRRDFSRLRHEYTADQIVAGGRTRQGSVTRALESVNQQYVFVHDGARPFFTEETLERLQEAMENHLAATPAIPSTDTLRYVENGQLEEDVVRNSLMRLQTPQAFEVETLRRAHALAEERGIEASCDAGLVREVLQEVVAVVEGDRFNEKLTRPEDVPLLEMILDDEDWT